MRGMTRALSAAACFLNGHPRMARAFVIVLTLVVGTAAAFAIMAHPTAACLGAAASVAVWLIVNRR
jgi:hypothetical protein